MASYFFITGQNKPLCRAEIYSFFEQKGISPVYSDQAGPAIIFDLPEHDQIFPLIDKLGGTIKIGKIIQSTSLSQLKSKLTDKNSLSQLLHLPETPERVRFGLSSYSDGSDLTLRELTRLGLSIKTALKILGYSARWVSSKINPLSSVIVTKNDLIKRGGEIVLFIKNKKVSIGRTLEVQDFEKYSQRDYGRPHRDMKQGLLPPKVAQIMINLAQASSGAVLLDPFCGAGTVLQEAWLMGYSNLVGIDNNPQAIISTEKNLQWLKACYQLPEIKTTLKTNDVRTISNLLSRDSVDAIVTEPYLGPVNIPSNHNQLEEIKDDVTDLLREAFSNFQLILKKQGRVVIIIPGWKLGNEFFRIDLSSVAIESHFKIKTYPGWIGNLPFVYHRADQKVIREIYVLQKK